MLNEDGLLFLECPSIDRWYGKTIDYFFWEPHINTFSKSNLLNFVRKSGFEIINCGWRSNFIWVVAKKTVIPQKIIYDNATRLKRILLYGKVEKCLNSVTHLPISNLRVYKNILKDQIKQNPKFLIRIANKKIKNHLGFLQILSESDLKSKYIAIRPKYTKARFNIAHIGGHSKSNAGDALLFPAVRWLFQKEVAPINFKLINTNTTVTNETINQINKQDAVVIGGGGLFLADTNPNSLSGWQWACPFELLEKIKVPIIIFAVGHNRFRGQAEFEPIFKKNLQLLIEKSAFVGIRNQGSINSLKLYLPESLHHKIHFQPCPTTVLKYFYPNLPTTNFKQNNKPLLAVNIAFDRHHLRFGNKETEILWTIADSLIKLKQMGWDIKLYNHLNIDNDAQIWFKARGLKIEEVNLYNKTPNDILKEYSKPTISVGMRGHAQMIPMGLKRPIYSLITHDKLRFLLEDISHLEWSIEVHDPDLGIKLFDAINNIYNNIDSIESEIELAQKHLWNITSDNMNSIYRILNLSPLPKIRRASKLIIKKF